MIAPRFVLMGLLVVGFVVPAATAADKPERATFRVTGLFNADREKDLREAFKELPEVALVGVDFAEAEITVEFVPGKAFPGAKPDQIPDRLDQKLRGVTRSTFGVKPRRVVPREKLEEVVIPVAGHECKGCCLAAYESVSNIDGVYRAVVSFKDGKLTALIDPAKTDRGKLEDALRKKGVTVGKP